MLWSKINKYSGTRRTRQTIRLTYNVQEKRKQTRNKRKTNFAILVPVYKLFTYLPIQRKFEAGRKCKYRTLSVLPYRTVVGRWAPSLPASCLPLCCCQVILRSFTISSRPCHQNKEREGATQTRTRVHCCSRARHQKTCSPNTSLRACSCTWVAVSWKPLSESLGRSLVCNQLPYLPATLFSRYCVGTLKLYAIELD